MQPVGEAQYPQECSFRVRPVGDRLVQAASPELRLAVWGQVPVRAVRLDGVDDLEDRAERLRQARRRDEVEVVRRGVILSEEAVRCAREGPQRQVEAG